jgi:hypothetical protein
MSKKLALPLILVAITLVIMWNLTQATFTSVTLNFPHIVVATPTHIVQNHHKTK